MASESVLILCYFDGTLTVDCNGRPNYNGEKIKTFRICTRSKFAILKRKIYNTTGINPKEFDLKVVCKCPTTSQDYMAVEITDDEGTKNMLSLYPTVPSIILLVVKESITRSEIQPPLPQAGFLSMLEMDNDSAGFMSPMASQYGMTSVPSQIPVNESYSSGMNVNPSSSFQYTQDNEMEIPPSSYHCTQEYASAIPEVTCHPSYMTLVSTEVGPSTMNDESTSDDSDGEYDAPILQSSMHCVHGDDDGQWVHQAYAHNEYVEFEDPPPDDIINEVDVRNYAVGNIVLEERREMRDDECFFVEQIFSTKNQLVQAISEWSLRRCVAFKTVRSTTTTMYTIACANATGSSSVQCQWRLHASVSKEWRDSKKFTIKKYTSEHTCRNSGRDLESRQVTTHFVCECILPVLRSRLDLTPAAIQDHIKLAFHRDITYYKAWDARRKALYKLFGDWKTSYRTLSQYMIAIQRSNPSTVYHITCERVDDQFATFKSLFWAFGTAIEGFQHCRPILSIDGTHLYGKYRGCLLVATWVDGDGGLYPLAFAVVDAETTANWEWFFACIWKFIPSIRRRQITWLSDRMKGLPRALSQGWPGPHFHRYCLRHIRANFKLKFKDESLQNMLYSAGSTYDPLVYADYRKKIKEKCPAADAWIESSLGASAEDRWVLCKDGGRRYCIMTTNCSESFNGVLKGARALPIQSIVSRTFYRLNHYFVTRRDLAAKWDTQFTPSTESLLRDRVTESRYCKIERFSINNWEIIDRKGQSYDVVLDDDQCECSCNIPLLQKIPCSHVIKACSRSDGGTNIVFENYVSQWYKTENYQLSYAPTFRSVPDNRYWLPPEGTTLLPPVDKRKKGRPKSTRIKGAMDDQGREGERRKVKCGKCKQYGHNRSTCPKN